MILFLGLESFVIRCYGKTNLKAENIPDLRWLLFTRFSNKISKLPPTLATLKYRIFRAHYVALVLKRCSKAIQNLPDATGYGWENVNNALVPILTDELPAPTELIELSMCSCKTNCETNRCSCRKNKLSCTEMCRCSDTCNNSENHSSTISESEDDDNYQ